MEIATLADKPARLRTSATWLLTHAAHIAQRLVAEAWASTGARRYHYAVLAALEEFGPASQAAIGRRCEIDRSDVVAVINELVEQGFVERTTDPTDRRRNTITLTPAGLAQLHRIDAALAAVQETLLAPLPVEDRTEFVRLLTQLLDYHTRVGSEGRRVGGKR